MKHRQPQNACSSLIVNHRRLHYLQYEMSMAMPVMIFAGIALCHRTSF